MATPTRLGDRSAAQRAFVGLLVRPLLTQASDPELYRDVTRSGQQVGEFARRLGYRVVRVGRALRLVRVPVAGTVTAPPPPIDAPDRRVLALTCLLAAACEDAPAVTTLAELSTLVGQLGNPSQTGATAYDQGQQSHRRSLVHAARRLEHWGVLSARQSSDELLVGWTDAGTGIGRIYDVDREALLLLTTPDVLAQVGRTIRADSDELDTTRTVRALRALVETPVVAYADLAEADATALRETRGFRSSEAAAITGGRVEARTEALILLMPDEPPSPATIGWPRVETVAWVALRMLDAAATDGVRVPDGRISLPAAAAPPMLADLIAREGRYMGKELRNRPVRLLELVERQLVALGLLRLDDRGDWWIAAAAGRYRHATILPPVGREESDDE